MTKNGTNIDKVSKLLDVLDKHMKEKDCPHTPSELLKECGILRFRNWPPWLTIYYKVITLQGTFIIILHEIDMLFLQQHYLHPSRSTFPDPAPVVFIAFLLP
ncbi:MAG: hypothetical protein QN649_09560, partial [Nitrososphaeraceae archaeon]|nr:hypothetical protein [Nitrososphaeraceae archaeon]